VLVPQGSACAFSGCSLKELAQDLLADLPHSVVLERRTDQSWNRLIQEVRGCIGDRWFAVLPQRVLTSVSDWIAVLSENASRPGLAGFRRLQPSHQTSTGQPFDDRGAFLQIRSDGASNHADSVGVVATEPLVGLAHQPEAPNMPMHSRQSWQKAVEALR